MLISQLFDPSTASVVFDKYPECVPVIASCQLAFRNIPMFFYGSACLTFRLHILKTFGVLIFCAYLHVCFLFDTRREITKY